MQIRKFISLFGKEKYIYFSKCSNIKKSEKLLFSTNNIRSTGFYTLFSRKFKHRRFSETIVPIKYIDKGFFTVQAHLKLFILQSLPTVCMI